MIRVENLEKYYDRHKKNEKHVLQKINLELPSHGLIAVVGEWLRKDDSFKVHQRSGLF